MNDLSGKVAIVTGAAGGIGAAIAQRFIKEGATVMLVDRHEGPLGDLIATLGPRASAWVADVADEAVTQRFVAATVERFGGLDIYVANAGTEGRVAPYQWPCTASSQPSRSGISFHASRSSATRRPS